MNSNLNLGDLYRIHSALVDYSATAENEELALTKMTISKVTEMYQELTEWLVKEYTKKCDKCDEPSRYSTSKGFWCESHLPEWAQHLTTK